MARRKRCMAYIEEQPSPENVYPKRTRCTAKIKPGTPFCKEHFLTHRIITVKCNGEAHSNGFIDHCGVCMPHWGKYPIAVPKDFPAEQVDGFLSEGGQVGEYD